MSDENDTEPADKNSDSDNTIFTAVEPDQRGSPEDAPVYEGQWAANSAPEPDIDNEATSAETVSQESVANNTDPNENER